MKIVIDMYDGNDVKDTTDFERIAFT